MEEKNYDAIKLLAENCPYYIINYENNEIIGLTIKESLNIKNAH